MGIVVACVGGASGASLVLRQCKLPLGLLAPASISEEPVRMLPAKSNAAKNAAQIWRLRREQSIDFIGLRLPPVDISVLLRKSSHERTTVPMDIEQATRQLSEVGYVIFRDVVSKSDLAVLQRTIVDKFVAAKSSGGMFDGGGNISGHVNCFPGKEARFAYDQVDDYGIVKLVKALAPGLIGSVRVNCNLNLPQSVAQHYHIDGYFTEEFLICNVATVDTDVENGAIDVLPGTNQQFYKFWQYALQRKYRLTTRVPLQQGDVLLRKSTLWHRGMPNKTEHPRPMLGITFGESSAPQGDPFAENDGDISFTPNWYNTDRLGQIRESAFVKMPMLYSSYRFARSLYGNKGYSGWK